VDPAALAATERLLRRAVLRIAPAPARPESAGEDPGASPWFAGAESMLHALAESAGGAPCAASAFGGTWPALELAGRVIAPGLPVVVAGEVREGPEGDYWRDGDQVLRSVLGGSEVVLALGASSRAPGLPADLLWFGDGERCVLAGGDLTIDDRFCRLRVPATPEHLERELVRRRRTGPAALAGLPTAPGTGQCRLEVRRAAALIADEAWREPARALAVRAGVERVDLVDDRVRLDFADGARVELDVARGPQGWRARRHSGPWPFLALEMTCCGAEVAYAAELDPRVDPLRPGVRTRLAFDLGSDLVVLGGAESPGSRTV